MLSGLSDTYTSSKTTDVFQLRKMNVKENFVSGDVGRSKSSQFLNSVFIILMGLFYNVLNSQTIISPLNDYFDSFRTLLNSDGFLALDRLSNTLSNSLVAYDTIYKINERIVQRIKKKKEEKEFSSEEEYHDDEFTSEVDIAYDRNIQENDELLKSSVDQLVQVIANQLISSSQVPAIKNSPVFLMKKEHSKPALQDKKTHQLSIPSINGLQANRPTTNQNKLKPY